jgi:hypothetical protein
MNTPPRRSKISLTFGIILLVLGLLVMFGALRGYQLDTRILEQGARAEGHVTKKVVATAADGKDDHGIDYWFALPDGKRIEAHAGVPKEMWDGMREGDTIPVAYSEEYPPRNFPVDAGVTSGGITMFVGAFGAVFAVLGGLLIGGYVRAGRALR